MGRKRRRRGKARGDSGGNRNDASASAPFETATSTHHHLVRRLRRMEQGSMDLLPVPEQPPHYKIQVKMVKAMTLDVKCSYTIDQLKSKISAIEGIDKSQQALFFAGNHLEDNNSLVDYNITTNSSVDLYVTDAMQISVHIPAAGKIIKLNLKKSLSVADVKAEIEQKGGIPLDEQILMYGCQQLEDNNVC